MQTVSYQEARDQLAGLIAAVSKDREPIAIANDRQEKVVLLPLAEYESMEATIHLFSSKANAQQIQQSLADYAVGKIQTGELCD